MRSLCPGICFSEIKLTSAVWLLEANVETGSRLEAVSKHPEGVEGRKLRDLTVTGPDSHPFGELKWSCDISAQTVQH